MTLYNIDRKLASQEERIRTAKYSESNKELIFKFERSLFLEGLTKVRVLKYLNQLNLIAENFDFEFKEATRDDIEFVVEMILKSNRSEATKYDYHITLKRFFRWINKGKDPECTEWLKFKHKNDFKLPEEMLTEAEIKQMIETAVHPRDKALIATFWDAGGRTGEIGELKIKHLVFDKYGVVMVVDGKTGMRRVRLVFSAPYLASWLDIHPDKHNPDAYLWVGIGQRGRSKQLNYSAMRMLIKRLAEKAGIKKRVYNHLFRHSRSTDLAQYLTEAQMKEHLGWTQSSKMAATYVHLSGKQIDQAILKMYGIVDEKELKPELTAMECPRCKHMNGSTSGFCSRCGMALRVDVAVDVEKKRSDIAMALMELVEKEPEIAKILRESV